MVFSNAVGWGLGRELEKSDSGYKDWDDLMVLLDLREEMALGAQEALKETGWRAARHPRAYLRNAAIRINSRDFGIELTAPKLVHIKSRSGMDNTLDPHFAGGGRSSYHPRTDPEYDSVALSGSGAFYSASDEPNPGKMTTAIRLGAERFGILDTPNIPFRLLSRDESDKLVANWAAIGPELDRIGVSRAERSVIIMRNQGMSRQDILDTAKTPEERKSFQSAYRAVSQKLSKIQLGVFRPFVSEPPPRKYAPHPETPHQESAPFKLAAIAEPIRPTPKPLRPPLKKTPEA